MRKITMSLVCAFMALLTMAQTETELQLSVMDAAPVSLQHPNIRSVKLNEGFDGTFPPQGWTLIDEDGDGHGFKQSKENYGISGYGVISESRLGTTTTMLSAKNYLVSPQIEIGATDHLYLWARNANSNYPESIEVMVSEKTATAADFVRIDSIALTGNNWNRIIVDLSTYNGKNVFVALRHSAIKLNYFFIADDFVIMPKTPLITLSKSVNLGKVMPNQSYSQTAFIANLGTDGLKISKATDLTSTQFSVDLNVSEVNLPTMGQAVFNVTFSPTKAGKDSVAYVIESNTLSAKDTIWFYGTGDELTNNQIQIGKGYTEKKGVPTNAKAAYAYSQSIFKKDELSAIKGKRIEKIYYHANGFSAPSQNIWTVIKMGHTELNELTGWLPQEELKMVYRGSVKVGAQHEWVEITLDEPFYYDDTKNLVIAYYDAQGVKTATEVDFFYGHDVTGNMTRFVGSGSYINTNALPTGNLVSYRPNIRFEYNDYPEGGELRFDPKNLSFPMVKAGVDTLSKIVWFKNTGTKDLKVANYTSSDDFSMDLTTEMVVKSGEQVSRTVFFHPTLDQKYDELIEFEHDGTGETTLPVAGSAHHKDALLETFNGADFPPVLWDRAGTGWASAMTGNANGKVAGNTAPSNPVDTLITPLLQINKGDSLVIRCAGFYADAPIEIVYSPDKENWFSFETIIAPKFWAYTDKTVYFNDSLGINYIGFAAKPTVYIDNVFGPKMVIPEAEMFVKNFNGPRLATLKADNIYTVEVFNGSNFPTEEYKVEFFADSVKIGETQGAMTLPFKTANVNFALNTDTIFNGRIHAYINFPKDTDTTNNYADYIDVKMVAENNFPCDLAFEGAVGNNEAPISLNYSYSLTQTHYNADQFVLGGFITHIGYLAEIKSEDIKDLELKVWIAETNLTDLKGGWIPANKMTQVFDGKVNCEPGNITLKIPFSTPFKYNGGNIVVMVERPDNGNWYSTDDRFLVSPLKSLYKTWKFVSDEKENDPNNPVNGNLVNETPATIFSLDVSKTGLLAGSVYSDSDVLLDGVAINVKENAYQTVTKDGNYQFDFLNEGTYTLQASKFGFFNADSTITIKAGVENTMDIELEARYMAQVSSTVVDAITNKVIEGAVVSAMGYNTYTDTTDANGNFALDKVYEDGAYYKYRVQARGYYSYVDSFLVKQENFELDTIRMDEFATPAFGVTAQVNADEEADVKWISPKGKLLEQYILEDGLIQGKLGLGVGKSYIVGNKFETNAKGHVVSVDVFGLATEGAGNDTVFMMIFNDKSEPLAQVPFFMPANKVTTVQIPATAFEGNFYAAVYWKSVPEKYNALAYNKNSNHGYAYTSDGFVKIAPLMQTSKVTFIIRPTVIVDNGAKEVTLPLAVDNTLSSEFSTEEKAMLVSGDAIASSLNSRAFVNFNVYRLPAGNSNMNDWKLLAENTDETQFTDVDFADIAHGTFQYSVLAKYTNYAAKPAYSNGLAKFEAPSALKVSIDSSVFKHTVSWEVTNNDEVSFHIFLNDEKVGETAEKSFVLDTVGLENGKTYTVGVKAVYTTGMSALSTVDFDAYLVGNNDAEAIQFNMYPVPASEYLSIEAQEIIDQVIITNVAGEIVKEVSVAGNNVVIDLNDINSGMYLINVKANQKQTIKKLIIE